MVLKGGERGRGGRREEIIKWGRGDRDRKEEETLARSERGRGE